MSLQTTPATDDGSKNGYIISVDLEYTDTIKNKTHYLTVFQESKKIDKIFHCFCGKLYTTKLWASK